MARTAAERPALARLHGPSDSRRQLPYLLAFTLLAFTLLAFTLLAYTLTGSG